MICSFRPVETSTTLETSTEFLSVKEAWKKPLLRVSEPRKEAQTENLSPKEDSLKFVKFLKFLRDKNYIESFWSAWFGPHRGREVFHAGIKDRVFLENAKSLFDYIQECEVMGFPAWMSAQPFRGRDQVFGLEKLFFDFDCENDPSLAWKEACDFVLKLEKFYDVKSLLAYSGWKGFHVYVWLWKTVEFQPDQERLAKEVYKKLQSKLLKGLKYETLDPQVIGDIKRLARIPYTLHEETQQPCMPVTVTQQPLQVLPEVLDGYRLNGLQAEVFERVTKDAYRKRRERHILIKDAFLKSHINSVRPCIANALSKPNLLHKMRLACAIEYLASGLSINEVVALFHSQNDFNEAKTRYQVEHAQRSGYKPRKCSTIESYGFCLGAGCVIYRKREAFP